MARAPPKPADLTERRTSPTCAERLGGLRRRGPLRQAGNAAGGTMRRLVVASALLATVLMSPLALVAAAPGPPSAPARPAAPNVPALSPTDSARATGGLAFLLGSEGQRSEPQYRHNL